MTTGLKAPFMADNPELGRLDSLDIFANDFLDGIQGVFLGYFLICMVKQNKRFALLYNNMCILGDLKRTIL